MEKILDGFWILLSKKWFQGLFVICISIGIWILVKTFLIDPFFKDIVSRMTKELK